MVDPFSGKQNRSAQHFFFKAWHSLTLTWMNGASVASSFPKRLPWGALMRFSFNFSEGNKPETPPVQSQETRFTPQKPWENNPRLGPGSKKPAGDSRRSCSKERRSSLYLSGDEGPMTREASFWDVLDMKKKQRFSWPAALCWRSWTILC